MAGTNRCLNYPNIPILMTFNKITMLFSANTWQPKQAPIHTPHTIPQPSYWQGKQASTLVPQGKQAQEKLEAAIALNPFIGEAHIVLAQGRLLS